MPVSLQQQLAKALRQTNPAGIASNAVVAGREKDGVQLAGALHHGLGRDLASVVDVIAGGELKARVGIDQGIQVGHQSVLPNEGSGAADSERVTDDLAEAVHAQCKAIGVAGDDAQILEGAVLPPEGVLVLLASERGEASHAALFV